MVVDGEQVARLMRARHLEGDYAEVARLMRREPLCGSTTPHWVSMAAHDWWTDVPVEWVDGLAAALRSDRATVTGGRHLRAVS